MNVSLNKLYPDKTNKDYNFCITFLCFCINLWHFIPCWQLGSKMLWTFSVNKFKTLDKTNKINKILCRQNFNLLAYLSIFQQKFEQTVNISQESEEKRENSNDPPHHGDTVITGLTSGRLTGEKISSPSQPYYVVVLAIIFCLMQRTACVWVKN